MDMECKINGTKSGQNATKWQKKTFWNEISCKLYELGS